MTHPEHPEAALYHMHAPRLLNHEEAHRTIHFNDFDETTPLWLRHFVGKVTVHF